ncbi:TPA: hypothetical protein N0F65_003407, partial [Lagenidium giganteum]
MQATGEAMPEGRPLVILLGSLPAEYDMLCTVIENANEISLIEVK